jgi:multidrug resistance efflux pump
MRGHTSLTLYFLALLLTIAVAWACHTTVEVTIEAGGILRPDGDVVSISTESGGRISTVRFGEGEPVHQGDILLTLDGRDLALRQRMLESQIHAATQHVRELRAGLEEATVTDDQAIALSEQQIAVSRRLSEMTLLQSARNLEQSKKLFAEGLLAKQTFQEAQNATERAKADLARWTLDESAVKRAQSQARQTERHIEIDSAQAGLVNLQQQREQLALEIHRLSIISPADGEVASVIPLHPGEVLAAGTVIATVIPRESRLVIESWIPASQRHRIEVGSVVRAQANETPDPSTAFEGIVLSISPDARITGSSAAYRVRITPFLESPLFQAGMTFQIHFITGRQRLLSLLLRKIYP